MGQLRQVLSMIQAQMTRLSASQKLLMASLAVIMLMTLFLVTQYSGRNQMVELMPGAGADQQQRAIEALQLTGVSYRTDRGKLLVRADQKHLALAQLSQGGALPADSSLLFSNIVEKQSWAMSADQRRQMERLALQNELALTIAQFDGVRSAKVLIDAPEPIGLGSTARRPTASATVFTSAGGPLSQRTVDAVAAFIAGAKSGLTIEDIRVIDGSTNTQRRPTSDDDVFSSTNFDRTRQVEKRVREKLLDLLSYIHGVIVAVNAQVDTRRINTESRRILPTGAGSQTFPLRESSKDETQTNASPSAEAGARPNTGLDLNRGPAGGTQMTRSESESELRPEVGYETKHVLDPRGVVTKLNATINVPRSYFIARYRESNDAGADAGSPDKEPSDAELKPVIDREIARITADVLPLVDTPEQNNGPGGVIVSMIPDWSAGAGAESAGAGALGVVGGVVTLPGMVKTVALGALALLSLGLMARTLKRASKPVDLPIDEELTGAPPVVRVDPEMIGVAAEAESALAGVELSDTELDRRKMLEQVQKLIEAEPQSAASILNKWVVADA